MAKDLKCPFCGSSGNKHIRSCNAIFMKEQTAEDINNRNAKLKAQKEKYKDPKNYTNDLEKLKNAEDS